MAEQTDGDWMQLQDQAAVAFLRGVNSVRDGTLIALSVLAEVEWEPAICLEFHVPNGTEGEDYRLELRGGLSFDYGFCSPSALEQIAFVKCLWTEADEFYLSLDPWKESERFISDQDNDWFKARSAKLTIARRPSPAAP